jgi:metal-responsive CopG/Arc/MetJ family transcriptional regulator
MRTTIRLDDELLARAKAVAAEGRTSLNAVIEDALRQALARREQASPSSSGPLPIVSGNGLRPGIDLNRGAELLDWLDRE